MIATRWEQAELLQTVMDPEHVLVLVIVMPILVTVQEMMPNVLIAWMVGIGLRRTNHAPVRINPHHLINSYHII